LFLSENRKSQRACGVRMKIPGGLIDPPNFNRPSDGRKLKNYPWLFAQAHDISLPTTRRRASFRRVKGEAFDGACGSRNEGNEERARLKGRTRITSWEWRAAILDEGSGIPMSLNPYLDFNGQCEKAFKFYEKHLGGKITFMMTYEGSPMASQAPPGYAKKILHARTHLR
jgi:hypothetical protein